MSLARRPGRAQVAGAGCLGLLIGGLLGYVFIGSVDRILQARAGSSSILTHRPLDAGGSEPMDDTALGRKEAAGAGTGADAQPGASSDTSGGASFPRSGDTVHTLMTSNGSPYLNFQTRIMYGTYRLAQQEPGGERLVGFTRILHRTQPDVLMAEVPTFRAEPLTPQCDGWCEFPVSDRPNAVAQFFAAAQADPSLIKAPWLLMLEGDYVWMRPLQPPRAESPLPSWAFPYSYIQPQAPGLEPLMRRMFPPDAGPLSLVPPSGPAPVLMRVAEWLQVTPDWERLAAFIEANADVKEKLGWVREMYAFSVATALQGVTLQLLPPGESPLMVQPPADRVQGNAALCHYTWGTLVEEQDGSKAWVFDKREYVAPQLERKTPRIPLPPPFRPGLKLHDGSPWDAALHNLTSAMLTRMNSAIERLPEL